MVTRGCVGPTTIQISSGRFRIGPGRPTLGDVRFGPAAGRSHVSRPVARLAEVPGRPRISGLPTGVDDHPAAALEGEGSREQHFAASPDAERMLAQAELQAANLAGIDGDLALADTDVDARLHHLHDQGPF